MLESSRPVEFLVSLEGFEGETVENVQQALAVTLGAGTFRKFKISPPPPKSWMVQYAAALLRALGKSFGEGSIDAAGLKFKGEMLQDLASLIHPENDK